MSVTDEMLCFSLYSASRATTQAYRTLLAPWNLTYPQYLVLAVLWNDGEQTIRSLGETMHLDSGTLSPLVRRLEQAGLVTKERSAADERSVIIRPTADGLALRAELSPIHTQVTELAGIHDDAQRRRLIDELHALTALLQNVSATPDLPLTK